jgi:hypothetical protein
MSDKQEAWQRKLEAEEEEEEEDIDETVNSALNFYNLMTNRK